ncbi:hypothetical protein P153DRAFT_426699 [Dothidotthia symphoricarpi CBS 119687]|uniref:NACHT domain-containing protein n=1 Tax=Dothidotthia symphoricarpi CBS 119687 TaxID=1392245 RepID=A0A6A5ZZF0_9PLEO|nr:uncharacterized protein P153DRAFT_426699 [Dothidotthia symphoricarpi CBS 119687]KAF2124263.1 hypothetical protein P153DRAFT_426699 [Dothidotthia symphoricarpi CBS 119687]
MRLLQIDAGGNLSLIERDGKQVPRYAILSHTWGADGEEVTLKDLADGTGQTKAGYQKIRFCGKQAAEDGLHYFWVDTCCIDKSSSAELSEAINSMFRWYYNADKCYVYLSDVPATTAFDSNDQSFQKSRWFTRGWTLQELIAPKSVEFFSSEGQPLGDKNSLVQEISTITRVPVTALQGKTLSQFSVDERMSWAGNRETKREEDAAYCLLGLFDIHMPLLYGEGQRRALKRLRDEVEDSKGLDRILKWLAPPEFATVYHESLSEREDDTGQWIFDHPLFCEWLNETESTMALGRLRWIHGHPGGGKTILAASVIHRLSSQRHAASSEPNVFYFFFRDDTSLLSRPISAYRSILSQFLHRNSDKQPIVDKFSSVLDNGQKQVGQLVSSEPELIDLLRICLSSLDRTYIILDGVDECNNTKSLIKVIESLGKLSAVRILIFSRPNVHGLTRLIPEQDRLAFGQHEVNDDIRLYLSRSLESMAREHRLHPNADLNQYVQHLVVGADKMFLWAKLMISYLQSPALTCSMIEKLIWNITLPEGLEIMYDRIFDIIGQSPTHQRELATRILSWVIYSRRELSIIDLQTVVASTLNDADAVCEVWPNFVEVVPMVTCGLVTCQKTYGSSNFNLIHLSASEYITEWKPSSLQPSSVDLLRPSKVTANLVLATSSLQLLLRAGRREQPSNGLNSGLHHQPMVAYAARHWISHLDSSIITNPDTIWDHGRLCKSFKELQKSLSSFLTSSKVVATFVDVFYQAEYLGHELRVQSPLNRKLRTVLEWTEWVQTSTFLDSSSQELQSTLTMIRAFCNEMMTFVDQWESKLVNNPSPVWSDALIFRSTRFLPQSDLTSTTSFAPRKVKIAGVSSRPLCHISVTSKDTDVLGVLSIWPSERYEKFWRNLDPYAAYSQVETFCNDWTAHYELWSTDGSKQLIFKVTIPLEAFEVALQMRQGFRHEHDVSWKTSFPTTISPDGLTLSVLRTLYQFSRSSLGSEPAWKKTVLPLHSIDCMRQKWGNDLEVFDPNNSFVKNLPTSLRLLSRDWYTYTITFSPDCRYLLFSDHQVPFKRNLILFGNLNNGRSQPDILSLTVLNTAKAELRLTIFHPTSPLIAFVCSQSAWIWNFGVEASSSLSRIHFRPEAPETLNASLSQVSGHMAAEIPLDSKIIAMSFSLCGKYISITLEHGSVVVPLNAEDLATNSEKAGSSQDTQMEHLSNIDQGSRPAPITIKAILHPTASQEVVRL